ncbi:LD-carboxypeptidase [Acinetobacter sp. Marseille-Q1618]|uniref:LD-carboxypeptidase n=1 Tax=Acinetobacter sp. Marseille-Q1618 TaxID=2697502 RepID=UPI00156F2AE3|nr:LD-carboxypeptidase [Acinetobacter sp. Marseille-Q1618]
MHFHIVAPSACVDIEKVELAQEKLQRLGHEVSLAEHVFEQYRYLAGTTEQRLQDLKKACEDPAIDAIWCARGGTGAAMLLPYLQEWILNKPIIGYSDSTVLLNYIAMQGGFALHAPVFQEIACKNLENAPLSTDALESIALLNTQSTNTYALTALNSFAQCFNITNAHILGGNLTVLCTLQGTPYHLQLKQPSILLIEDVGEPYYCIERSFIQLLQSIDTGLLKAVVLGDFYHCPQKNVPHSLTQILNEHLEALNIPLYKCDWFGHGEHNRPFWLGKKGRIQDALLTI